MSNKTAEQTSADIRWSATDAKAVCPHCACPTCYEACRPNVALRFRCKACRSYYSLISGTLFAFNKLPLQTLHTSSSSNSPSWPQYGQSGTARLAHEVLGGRASTIRQTIKEIGARDVQVRVARAVGAVELQGPRAECLAEKRQRDWRHAEQEGTPRGLTDPAIGAVVNDRHLGVTTYNRQDSTVGGTDREHGHAAA